MGLCLWKSLLCLRRANMRGWVIALFCCGTLRSDERRVPVVKTAKDQVFHQWRQGKALTERWLRSPTTLMLATAQEVIWFSEGQSTQQHPLVAGEQRVTQIFGKWLSSTAGVGALRRNSQFCKYQLCWLCVTWCSWTETQRGLCRHPATAQRANRGLCHEDAIYSGQICLAEYVHFVMQHDHHLSFTGKPGGQAAAVCLKRIHLSSSRRNMAEKLGPDSVLGVAVSTTDCGRADNSLCNKDIFPLSVNFSSELDETAYIELTESPRSTECNWRNWRTVFSIQISTTIWTFFD